jgi:uncharacterized protein (TIGR02147 family)
VGKRNITESSIPLLVQGLKLSNPEAAYFEKLVHFTQAQTTEKRELYGRELTKQSRSPKELREIRSRLRFMTDPLCPRMLALLTLEDAPRNLTDLALVLGVSESDASQALRTLENLNLVTDWMANVDHFEVKEDLGNLGLQSFYRKSLEESARAIELPVETRNFQFALFPLSADEYEKFTKEINDFLIQALGRYGANEGKSKRLYQVTTSLIPVSQPILHSDERRRVPVGYSQHTQSELSHQNEGVIK